jgi:hypothetical protein
VLPYRRQYLSKNRIFEKLLSQKIKRGKSATYSWAKITFLALKVEKTCPKRVVFIFLSKVCQCIFFGGSEFLTTIKPEFPLWGWFIGKKLEENYQHQFWSQILSTSAQSITHSQSIAHLDFTAKKNT